MDTDIRDGEHGSGIDYEPTRGVYRLRADPDDSLVLAAVELVSTALDRDPVDLPPIHGRIDADALESLFRGTPDASTRPRGFVEFTYVDCLVRIHGDGEVVARVDEPT